jgi:hypothetical protein
MLARMDYLAVEGAHLLERCREVGHGEIGKREAISWARAALVHADRHPRVHRLPTLTLVRAPRLERRPKQLLPEASRPIGIVGRKLDQEWQRCHDSDATENGGQRELSHRGVDREHEVAEHSVWRAPPLSVTA